MDLVTTELIVEKADTECEASAVITSIATDFIVDLLIELDLEKVNNLLVRVLNCILLFQPATRQFEVKEDVNVRERHFFQLLTRVRSQIWYVSALRHYLSCRLRGSTSSTTRAEPAEPVRINQTNSNGSRLE